jgi:predicted peptidase
MPPLDFDANKRYPVVLSLHGSGGNGTDNRNQLKQWNQQLADEEVRKDYPCYVLAPQSTGLWDETHLRKIQAIIAKLPAVDRDRIYMMGHSMGGHGSNILIQLAPK